MTNSAWDHLNLTTSNDGPHADTQSPSATSLSTFIQQGVAGGGIASICVLDTNTLLRATNLLDTLFKLLLQASHHSFLYCTHPAPFTILIPHQVLQELDGLKLNTSSSNVGSQARSASRWLLASVQAAARSSTDDMEYSSITLPPERRPIIIQTASQAKEYNKTHNHNDDETVDEAIVRLCSSLERTSGIPVLFCSNDVIARTRAESQGLHTFDLEAILKFADRRTDQILNDRQADAHKSMHDPSRRSSAAVSQQERNDAQELALRDAASTLLEQWAEQILPMNYHQSASTSSVTINPTTSAHAPHDSMPLDHDPPTTHDTHSPDLNPHVSWEEVVASSPQTRNRYLSYYEKRQREQQYAQQHSDSMALDGDASSEGRRRAPSTPGRTTADSVWAR